MMTLPTPFVSEVLPAPLTTCRFRPLNSRVSWAFTVWRVTPDSRFSSTVTLFSSAVTRVRSAATSESEAATYCVSIALHVSLTLTVPSLLTHSVSEVEANAPLVQTSIAVTPTRAMRTYFLFMFDPLCRSRRSAGQSTLRLCGSFVYIPARNLLVSQRLSRDSGVPPQRSGPGSAVRARGSRRPRLGHCAEAPSQPPKQPGDDRDTTKSR